MSSTRKPFTPFSERWSEDRRYCPICGVPDDRELGWKCREHSLSARLLMSRWLQGGKLLADDVDTIVRESYGIA